MSGCLVEDMANVRPGWPRSKRAQGQSTRGKTMPNRLRRVDAFLLLYDAHLLRREDGLWRDACFVDLGYGATPVTTVESAARLRRVNPRLPVLGVEIDPARVAAAQPFVNPLTDFRLGGFNLPLRRLPDGRTEAVRAIRAFNVLRQYEEAAVAAAYTELARHALPGALLIEGTSDPAGSVWVAHVLRRDLQLPAWRSEALVFSATLRASFDPGDFQPVLPKDLIHHMQPGEPIHDLMAAWKAAARRVSHERVWGERRWFMATGRTLHASGWPVDPRRRWLARGFLIVATR